MASTTSYNTINRAIYTLYMIHIVKKRYCVLRTKSLMLEFKQWEYTGGLILYRTCQTMLSKVLFLYLLLQLTVINSAVTF